MRAPVVSKSFKRAKEGINAERHIFDYNILVFMLFKRDSTDTEIVS
jgi:hypothetical protein